MKKHLRPLLLVLAVAIAIALACGLTACSPKDGPSKVDTRYKKFDPPITLTTTRTAGSADQLDAWKANPYIVWCEEKLGIIWEAKYVAASNDDHIRQLTLLANSNNLPDVLADGSDIFPELQQGGYLRTIEDDTGSLGRLRYGDQNCLPTGRARPRDERNPAQGKTEHRLFLPHGSRLRPRKSHRRQSIQHLVDLRRCQQPHHAGTG